MQSKVLQLKLEEINKFLLAILNSATDVFNQLNDGGFPNTASFDSVIELSSQHSLLSRVRIRERESVSFLCGAD